MKTEGEKGTRKEERQSAQHGAARRSVGIVTITDYRNYGNRLQNYASQQVLRGLGFETETLVNRPPKTGRQAPLSLPQRIRKALKTPPGILLGRLRNKFTHRLNRKLHEEALAEKEKAFRAFTDRHIRESDFVLTPDNIPADLGERHDYFVVGSDQVWNPSFRNGFSFDFLQFAPREKRVAYAPSFGVSVVPQEYVPDYGKWLSEMAHLSVREGAGAGLIRQLSGRESTVLVDPTLMLSREEWLKVARPAKDKPRKDYLLTYFLGEIPRERRKLMDKLAASRNLDIVQLGSMGDRARFAADPGEFIDYVDGASLFLTDSFHGAVFSILFEKPFVVFSRQGRSLTMSSRIDTLLTTFRLMERKWEHQDGKENHFSVDYSGVAAILKAERSKALDYLRGALSVQE